MRIHSQDYEKYGEIHPSNLQRDINITMDYLEGKLIDGIVHELRMSPSKVYAIILRTCDRVLTEREKGKPITKSIIDNNRELLIRRVGKGLVF